MRFLSRSLILAVVSGAASFAGIAGIAGALADDPQPPIEENYAYPGADEIFRQRGIRLQKGDGHILLVDCNSGTGFAQVWSRSKGQLCFRIRGTTGYLTMKLPEVYLIAGGNDHSIQATVTVDGNAETVQVQKNEWISVGEGADPESRPATLLEFRASA
jgi:hypothetical protein